MALRVKVDKKQVKAVFFDFFGTLVDYTHTYTISLQPVVKLLKKSNIQIEEKRMQETINIVFEKLEKEAEKTLTEYPMHDVMDAVFKKLNINIDSKMVDRCIDLYLKEWNRMVIYDNSVPELLGDLARSYSVAIITNTHYPPLIKDHLRRMGIVLPSFPVITSTEYGRRKPCPTIYYHAARTVGVLPQHGLMIGDSLKDDYDGSIKAGMQAILLDRKGKSRNIPTISSLQDLREILL